MDVGSKLTDLLYANDTTLFTNSSSDTISCLSNFGESVSVLGKTQNVGALTNWKLLVGLPGQCSVFWQTCHPDIKRRIALASTLMHSIWKVRRNRRLHANTNKSVGWYQTLVLSILFIVSLINVNSPRRWYHNSWSVPDEMSATAVEHWQDHVRNTYERLQSNRSIPPIIDRIRRRRSAMFGHVADCLLMNSTH